MRASSSLPLTCSGDIYATVPTALPGLVRCAWESIVGAPKASLAVCGLIFASPKSRIFACPRSFTKMFAGLMSR